MKQKVCTRQGCGTHYSDESNNTPNCLFHDGVPVFHDGLKGWSCCVKRVVSFDDFLKIPGCIEGFHTNEQNSSVSVKEPQEISKVDNRATAFSTFTASSILPEVPKKSTLNDVAPLAICDLEKNLFDPKDALVDVGTVCRRQGCGERYENNQTRSEKCFYHPGTPIFHEGSKGWSCCKRRVLEFQEFLKIKGCVSSFHRFLDIKMDNDLRKTIACRHDWYEMQQVVVLDIFVRDIDKLASWVNYDTNCVVVHLQTVDGNTFERQFNLFDHIIPSQSKHTFLSSKVEISLMKINRLSWSSLESS